jgi:hypothetical protein
MNTKSDRIRGSTMIVVMGMTMLATLAAGSIIANVLTRLNLADKQVSLEQAFYVAQAGAERAATYVAAGNESSTTLNGTLGGGSYAAEIECTPGSGGEFQIDVTSVGTVKGQKRTVKMSGLRRVSWARYALWYDTESSTPLWFVPGESFGGRVYAKPQLCFHDTNLTPNNQVRFFDKVWSVAQTIQKRGNANPVFEQGITLNTTIETMASVNFTELLSAANSGGLVLEGETTIVVENTTLKITNAKKSWTNKSVPIPAKGTVYVKNSTTSGNLTVSGPTGLKGRLTLVAENDINIVNHLIYKTNPESDPTSTDALGLIAKRNIAIQKTAPNNLNIFAHIICQNGGLGVVDHDQGSARGVLTIYGGLVNSQRRAVGTTGGTGYKKNYIYDTRFARNPPPNYPVLTDELEWRQWDG